MSDLIPKIKKELKSFILEEKGGAQKQVMISLGAMLAGLEALNVISQMVSGANISSRHDHCDPGHSNAHANITSGHSNCSAHSSADANPASHCNAGNHLNWGKSGWGHQSGHCSQNAGHANNIVLNYG